MKTTSISAADERAQTLWRMVNAVIANFAPLYRLHPVNVLMMILDVAVMGLANYSQTATVDYLRARADGIGDGGSGVDGHHARALAAGNRIVEAAQAEAEALERRLS
jgi:hypothetical protein